MKDSSPLAEMFIYRVSVAVCLSVVSVLHKETKMSGMTDRPPSTY